MNVQNNHVVTIDEVARAMGIGRGLAYRAAEHGELPFPCLRVGRRFVIPRRPFEEFLQTGKATSNAA